MISGTALKTEGPLLLLRGLLRERRHWGCFSAALKNRFPERDVFCLDIPGNGQCWQQSSPDSIGALTAAVRAQLPPLEMNGKPILIAISMGAMIALDWLCRFPGETAGAVLINTSVRPYATFYQRLRWQNYPRIAKLFLDSLEQREKTILALTSNHHRDDPEILAQWLDWQRQCPVSKANACRQIRASARFSCPHQPSDPLLIVASRRDRLVDYRCSRRLAVSWNCPYREHPSAGHDLPLDAPDWLSERIFTWLESGASPASNRANDDQRPPPFLRLS